MLNRHPTFARFSLSPAWRIAPALGLAALAFRSGGRTGGDSALGHDGGAADQLREALVGVGAVALLRAEALRSDD
jgi:hypothetical protein